MKRMIVIVLALITSYSFAADVLIFKHGVRFDHQGHQTEKVGSCTVCHGERVGKIKGFGKEWAHKHCINCHKLRNEGGPVNCDGCHKRMYSYFTTL